MTHYAWYQMILMAWAYGFIIWAAEFSFTSVYNHKFTKRGELHLPVLLSDAIALLIVVLVLERYKGNIILLFIASVVYGSTIHAIAGFIIEHVLKKKAWDYSDRKFHIGQYVCLSSGLYYGTVGTALVLFVHPIMKFLLSVLGERWGIIIASVLLIGTAADAVWIVIKDRSQKPKEVTKVFAEGYNIYKIIWIFLICALLGDIIETIFCRITAGIWMSRSSVLYGPFSVVWGFGGVFLTIVLHKIAEKNDRYIFLYGTIVGGAYEYLCSVVTEVCFGTVFWDYSKLPFNLGGRINLLYCFFWGLVSVVWIKEIYPRMSKLIERIPISYGRILTWILMSAMIVDMALSAGALGRAMERRKGQEAGNPIAEFMDVHYPDKVIDKVYPNMIVVEE